MEQVADDNEDGREYDELNSLPSPPPEVTRESRISQLGALKRRVVWRDASLQWGLGLAPIARARANQRSGMSDCAAETRRTATFTQSCRPIHLLHARVKSPQNCYQL